VRDGVRASARGFGCVDDGVIVGGDGFGHPGGERALLGRCTGAADPERGVSAGLDDLLGGPLELLARLRVGGECDEAVE